VTSICVRQRRAKEYYESPLCFDCLIAVGESFST
jgi:hypothetical protein